MYVHGDYCIHSDRTLLLDLFLRVSHIPFSPFIFPSLFSPFPLRSSLSFSHLFCLSLSLLFISSAHELAEHQTCVEAMPSFACMEMVMSLMRKAPSQTHLAADTLRLMFEKTVPPERGNLVKCAMDAKLVPFLLSVLDSSLAIENQAAAKAQLVKAMKAMTRDVTYGEHIRAELDASSVWASYRDQRHDLFLTHETVKGLLTGPTGPATKGYLTGGPVNPARITMGPPPTSAFSPPDL